MKKRLISAGIMAAIIVPLLLIRGKVFAVAIGLLGLIIYKEITDLKKDDEDRLPLIANIAGLISFLLMIYSNYDGNNLLFGIAYNKIALLLMIALVPVILISDFKKYSATRALRLFGLIFLVGLGLNTIISLVNLNIYLFLYLISITVCTDTFAFVVGTLIGKHKCSKVISSNKSWEGCIGGSLIGTIIPVVIYVCLVSSKVPLLTIIGVTLLLSVIGQFGDLFFSAIKREYKIKDFSKLIPGHGGVLDRIDSLIFVVITYLVFHIYL